MLSSPWMSAPVTIHHTSGTRRSRGLEATFSEHIKAAERAGTAVAEDFTLLSEVAARAMRLGSKIPLSGDGGGAADLQHTASEHTARMERASASLPALCPLDAPRGARGARRAPAPSAAVPVTQTKNIHPSPRLRRPRARTAPPPEGRETRPVVAEPGMPAVGLTVDVERVFGNVDADGILHCLSSPALVVRGNACSTPTYPFRTCERRGRSNF